MKCRPLIFCLPALLAAWVQAAPPQTVYRCGPEGRVYSQTPCADGKPVTVDDPRSASQQRSAQDTAARDAQQAKTLADERRQREQAAKGQQAAGIKLPVAESAASAPARKPKANPATADSKMSPLMRVPTPAPALAPR
jgi:hypothetical protein